MSKGHFEDPPDSGGSSPEFISGDNIYQPQLFRNVLARSKDDSLNLGNDGSMEFHSLFKPATPGYGELPSNHMPLEENELTEGLQEKTFQNRAVDQGKFAQVAEALGINQELAQSKFKELNSTTLSADLAAKTLTDMTLACWKRGLTPW